MPKMMTETEKTVAAEAQEEELKEPAEVETVEEQEETEKEQEAKAPRKKAEKAPKTIDDEIKSKTSRFSYTFEKASKKERELLYEDTHVFTEHGDEPVETETTALKNERDELVASADKDSHRILEGEIIGCRYADTNSTVTTVLAEVRFKTGAFSIFIPSYLLFDYQIDRYATPEGMEQLYQSITKRIGSKIKFRAANVNEKTLTAYADRLVAMSMDGVRFYTPQVDRKTGVEKKALLYPGRITKAQVVMVSKNFIVVDAYGAEIRIGQDELSYLHLGDARNEFSIGDEINVRIKTVETKTVEKFGNKYTLIDATASVKDAMSNPRDKFYEQFKKAGIGSVYRAKVTHVDPNKVFCLLADKMDCVAAFPSYGNAPYEGETRYVKITEFDDARKFIFGYFINP